MFDIEYVPFLELISDIIDNRGKTCPVTTEGIPLIATNCINNNSLYPVYEKIRYVSQETYDTWFRGHPKPSDLIFVTKGTPGRVCMVPDPISFCIAQDMVAIRANVSKVYPKYLFAVLRSVEVQEEIKNLHVGTLIPHFKKGDFNKLLIPLPNLDLQKIIGDIYYILSEKIELNTRMNKVLEEIARALFHRWFVEFEFPNDEGMPYKSSGGRMIASEMGEIPEGWSVGTLDEIAKITMGQSPSGTSYNEQGTGTVFYQGRAEFGFRYPSRRLYTTEPKRMAEKGDVLLSVRAPVGDINIANESCCIGRGLAAIQSIDNYPSFIYYLMLDLQKTLDSFNGEGTVFGSINRTALASLKFVLPPNSYLELFGPISHNLDLLIEKNSLENLRLQLIRDSLLPKFMSGALFLK